jgi:hypothetical protein
MSDDLNELPEWLTDRQPVNDERILAIDLQVIYNEGQFPNFETPLQWAEEMLRAANIMVEGYKEYINKLKENG